MTKQLPALFIAGLIATIAAACGDDDQWIIQGTVMDFVTRDPVPDVDIRYTNATQASLFGCNAGSNFKLTSDENGRFFGERLLVIGDILFRKHTPS
ncbi:MAG: hypothetical protein GY847_33335 [Proteobacteria bacterium]|nr:hypothetical protein [Pseudomonadota bacterium]